MIRSLKDHDKLLKDMYDLTVLAKRKDEIHVSMEEMKNYGNKNFHYDT